MDDIIHDQVDRDRMNSTTGSRSTADDRMDFSSDWENNFSHSGDRWVICYILVGTVHYFYWV